MIVTCPKCGSEDIREKNVAYAELPVTDWDVDENGRATPTAFDSDQEVEWTTDDVQSAQYVCRGLACAWEGTLEDLIVVREDGDDWKDWKVTPLGGDE